MKKLDVSAITDLAQFPIKKGTLQFLQDSNSEVFAAVLIGLIGSGYSATTVYVLYGCVMSAGGNSYAISGGAVFYGGECYLVDSATFTFVSPAVPILSIVTTPYTTDADPVTFTDNTPRYVHNIRKVVIAPGTAGSGISDYANVVFGLTASTSQQGMVELATNAEMVTGTSATLVPPVSAIAHYTGRVATKLLTISDWNMQSSSTYTKAHGLTWPSWSFGGNKASYKILSVRAIVYNTVENPDPKLDRSLDIGGSPSNPERQGYVAEIDNTNIILARTTGGIFDNADYASANDTTVYVLITYIPD